MKDSAKLEHHMSTIWSNTSGNNSNVTFMNKLDCFILEEENNSKKNRCEKKYLNKTELINKLVTSWYHQNFDDLDCNIFDEIVACLVDISNSIDSQPCYSEILVASYPFIFKTMHKKYSYFQMVIKQLTELL